MHIIGWPIGMTLALFVCCLPAESQEVETAVTPEGCRRDLFLVPSAAMQRKIRAWVVLPPAALRGGSPRFPVLIALHGSRAPYATWSEMSRLRGCLGTMPMIVAGFDGDAASQYVDSPVNPSSQFQRFLFDEFIPYLHMRYPTDGRQAITGFSMGGFGAVYSMLRRPEAFVSVSGLSSSLPTMRGTMDVTQFIRRFAGVLGPLEERPQAYEEVDVHALLAKRVEEGRRLPPMMLRCGTRDSLLPETRAFVDRVASLNAALLKQCEDEDQGQGDEQQKKARVQEAYAARRIDLVSVESDGGHNWVYWHGEAPAIAEFHWRWFQAQKR